MEIYQVYEDVEPESWFTKSSVLANKKHKFLPTNEADESNSVVGLDMK